MSRRSGGSLLSVPLAIASNTFVEAVRMKLFLGLGFVSLISFSSAFFLREFNFGSTELKFIMDFGFGGISLFGSLLAIIIATQLFYVEIEHRTAITALAKPISRRSFLVGKFLGIWATLAVFVATLSLCLLVAIAIRQWQLNRILPEGMEGVDGIEILGILQFALAQVFRLGLLASLAMLFGSYASSAIFTILISGLAWLIGQLQPVLLGQWQAADGIVSKALLGFLAYLLPNLSLFDLGESVVNAEAISVGRLGMLLAYGALYIVFYLGAAGWFFSKREL